MTAQCHFADIQISNVFVGASFDLDQTYFLLFEGFLDAGDNTAFPAVGCNMSTAPIDKSADVFDQIYVFFGIDFRQSQDTA